MSADGLSFELDLSPGLSSDSSSKYGEYCSKSLKERTEHPYSPTHNFGKFPCHKINKENRKLEIWEPSGKTGEMLRLDEIPYLPVLDIDMNHDRSKVMNSEGISTKNKIVQICRENEIVLGQPPSGWFHVYCNSDEWIGFARKIKSQHSVCMTTQIEIKNGPD